MRDYTRGMRDDIVLLCLAALGGLLAVAWGSRRLQSPEGDAIFDARTQLKVRLDALAARGVALRDHPDLPPPLRPQVDQVLADHADLDHRSRSVATPEDAHALEDDLRPPLLVLEEVAATVGLTFPADRPFVGLCAMDPAHGCPADAATSLCGECQERLNAGHPLTPRSVAQGGEPVPFSTPRPEHTDVPEASPVDASPTV